MTLDIFISSLSAAAGVAVVYGITRLKGIWILGALLYLAGGIMSSAAAYLIFYPLFASTHIVFIPAVTGFCVWTVLFYRLVSQHISLSRARRTSEDHS
jgi:hypothetical protein